MTGFHSVVSQSRAAAVAACNHDDNVYVINLMRIIIVVECCCEHYGKGLGKLKLFVETFLIFNDNPCKCLCVASFLCKYISAANFRFPLFNLAHNL